VRLIVMGKPRPLTLAQSGEGVGAMRRDQHPVEALVVVGADAIVLVDLALFHERRRIEIG